MKISSTTLKGIGIFVCLIIIHLSISNLSYPDDFVVGLCAFGLAFSMWCIVLILLPTIKSLLITLFKKPTKNVQRRNKPKQTIH